MMGMQEAERLRNELALLESMYPERVHVDHQAREVKYKTDVGALELRLPADYLISELPEVLSAHAGKVDLRTSLKDSLKEFVTGEEVLDSVILAFNDLAESAVTLSHAQKVEENRPEGSTAGKPKATIVVWLHHLLNTNKRKQALSPPSPGVSGVTKPGYPGVLIYSGPAKAVHEHVNELKQLNWAAFQVRLEVAEEWTFAHGAGVKEVEAMKEVVAEVGSGRKELFMEAMRMK